MKKALLLAENWPPRVGGIENYLTNIAGHLSSDEILVVAPAVSGKEQDSSPEHIRVMRKRFFWPIIRPKWLPLYRQLVSLVKKEDIGVVLCGKALFEGLAAYYIKKKLGIPYVVFTYAMEIEAWQQDPRTKKKLEQVLGMADTVVYINERTKRELVKLGVSEKALLKIAPGIHERFLQPVAEDAARDVRRKYNVQKPYVVTIARLVRRKGIDDLIEGFGNLDQTKFDDATLVIIGDGPEKDALHKVAEQNFLSASSSGNSQVQFLGYVPDEDLPALLSQAQLFALTPKECEGGDVEGFGIVYLEAAAFHLPAIASKSGGAHEAVEDGVTGIVVPPDSPKDITKALTLLLTDAAQAKAMGLAGRKRAEEHFTWKKKISTIRSLIRSFS